MRDDDTAAKTVLITGASRGIGQATALHLAAVGWDVLAGVRDAAAGKALAAESPRITPIDLDVTVPAQLAELDELLPERLDAVVNNAGIAVGGPVEAVSLNDLRWQFEVNVVGQVAVTQAVLPRLRQSRGRVVFVSSLNGRVSIPMSAAYSASKFAIEALADALRVELRPWGIRVILIEPGCIDTDPWRGMMDLLDGIKEGMRPEHRDLYAAHLAGQRKLCGKLQQQTKPPAKVAAAIERALTGKRPRSRHLVGPDARALVAMRAALPTRVLDTVWAHGHGRRTRARRRGQLRPQPSRALTVVGSEKIKGRHDHRTDHRRDAAAPAHPPRTAAAGRTALGVAVCLLARSRGAAWALTGATTVVLGAAAFGAGIAGEGVSYAYATDPAAVPASAGGPLLAYMGEHPERYVVGILPGLALLTVGTILLSVALLRARAVPLPIPITLVAGTVFGLAVPFGIVGFAVSTLTVTVPMLAIGWYAARGR